jgi:hypothetical protein
MRLDMSPFTILIIVAVVLFLLAAFGVALGTISLIPLGLALFAAAFLFGGGRGLGLGR